MIKALHCTYQAVWSGRSGTGYWKATACAKVAASRRAAPPSVLRSYRTGTARRLLHPPQPRPRPRRREHLHHARSAERRRRRRRRRRARTRRRTRRACSPGSAGTRPPRPLGTRRLGVVGDGRAVGVVGGDGRRRRFDVPKRVAGAAERLAVDAHGGERHDAHLARVEHQLEAHHRRAHRRWPPLSGGGIAHLAVALVVARHVVGVRLEQREQRGERRDVGVRPRAAADARHVERGAERAVAPSRAAWAPRTRPKAASRTCGRNASGTRSEPRAWPSPAIARWRGWSVRRAGCDAPAGGTRTASNLYQVSWNAVGLGSASRASCAACSAVKQSRVQDASRACENIGTGVKGHSWRRVATAAAKPPSSAHRSSVHRTPPPPPPPPRGCAHGAQSVK